VVFGQMYTNIAGFYDPGTASDWVFDDNAFGFGVAAQHEAVQGLILGGEFSLARPAYERRVQGTSDAARRERHRDAGNGHGDRPDRIRRLG
jgi:hypothetical protein